MWSYSTGTVAVAYLGLIRLGLRFSHPRDELEHTILGGFRNGQIAIAAVGFVVAVMVELF